MEGGLININKYSLMQEVKTLRVLFSFVIPKLSGCCFGCCWGGVTEAEHIPANTLAATSAQSQEVTDSIGEGPQSALTPIGEEAPRSEEQREVISAADPDLEPTAKPRDEEALIYEGGSAEKEEEPIAMPATNPVEAIRVEKDEVNTAEDELGTEPGIDDNKADDAPNEHKSETNTEENESGTGQKISEEATVDADPETAATHPYEEVLTPEEPEASPRKAEAAIPTQILCELCNEYESISPPFFIDLNPEDHAPEVENIRKLVKNTETLRSSTKELIDRLSDDPELTEAKIQEARSKIIELRNMDESIKQAKQARIVAHDLEYLNARNAILTELISKTEKLISPEYIRDQEGELDRCKERINTIEDYCFEESVDLAAKIEAIKAIKASIASELSKAEEVQKSILQAKEDLENGRIDAFSHELGTIWIESIQQLGSIKTQVDTKKDELKEGIRESIVYEFQLKFQEEFESLRKKIEDYENCPDLSPDIVKSIAEAKEALSTIESIQNIREIEDVLRSIAFKMFRHQWKSDLQEYKKMADVFSISLAELHERQRLRETQS